MKPLTVMRVWSRASALLSSAEHGFLVLGVLHVDEVEDDDAAEVAQPQLAGDGLRRLEVGLEDGVVEVASTDEAAGIDVDGGQRLGLVDDEVAAGFELDAPRQRLLDFVLDAVQVEQRPLAGVVREQVDQLRHVLLGEEGELLEVLARIDDDLDGVRAGEVAQHALGQRQVVVQQRRRLGALRALGDFGPEPAQVGDVGGQFLVRGRRRHGADDEAAGRIGRNQCLDAAAQGLALGLVLDALRDADVLFLRQKHQQPAGDGNLRGQPRALGADRVLEHLHDDVLALAENALDRPHFLAAAVPFFPDVGDVEEGGAFEADIDEGRLHARQDAGDAAEIDVADDAAAVGALDVQFLHHALLHQGDPRLLRGKVDQELISHSGDYSRSEICT